MPNVDIAEMFLYLTEQPYTAIYSSSWAHKKTLTGERGGIVPQAARIQFSAPRK
jgi:hypothetical protein